MIVRKTLLATAAAVLMSTPAWALPSQTPSNQGTERAPATTPVGPPSETPNNTDNPGTANRDSGNGQASDNSSSGSGDKSGSKGAGADNQSGKNDKGGSDHRPSHPGKSHKCMPHNVAYVASGSLLKWTLTKDENANTYSGEVEVEVKRTNHHAIADREKTVDYKVSKVHVVFAISDTNKDGKIGPEDLVKGDATHLIGKIPMLAKKCSQTGSTPEETIHRIVFHAAPPTPPTPPTPKS
jgi:hypothetical protein